MIKILKYMSMLVLASLLFVGNALADGPEHNPDSMVLLSQLAS